MVNVFILIQWLTDSLDGALGRYRKEGLVKWGGYYMDHLLVFFLCAILIGYSLLITYRYPVLEFLVLALCGGIMVTTFVVFGTTQEFRLVQLGFGPSEIRPLFIILNILILVFGKNLHRPSAALRSRFFVS